MTAFLLSLITSVAQADPLFHQALDREFLRWKRPHTELFVSVCRTTHGRALALFPVGHTTAILVEIVDGSVANLAWFRVDSRHAHAQLDFSNTQGGEYIYTEMQHHADTLLRLPYRLVRSSSTILTMSPSGNCQYHPKR